VLKNAANTQLFLHANGLNIMVKAVFRNNSSVVPLTNFKDESWMVMFEIQDGCLKVLTLIVVQKPELALQTGQVELALADKYQPTRISQEIDKNMITLRTTVVHMQTRLCVDVLLATHKITTPALEQLMQAVRPMEDKENNAHEIISVNNTRV